MIAYVTTLVDPLSRLLPLCCLTCEFDYLLREFRGLLIVSAVVFYFTLFLLVLLSLSFCKEFNQWLLIKENLSLIFYI